jgi:hypothetical protein
MPGEPPGSSDPLDSDGLVGRAAEAAAIRRLADRPAGNEARFGLPVTLRAYGGQMLRRLGQGQEFAARHKRWQDGQLAQDPAG